MILNRPGDRLREQILSVPARRLRATRPMVRMAWVLLALDVLAAVAITVMVILHTAPSATVPATAALVFMALSFAVVGGLLSQRRPRNAEGWLLLAVGTAWLVPMVSVGLGQSLLEHHVGGQVAAWLAWPGVWLWLPPLGLMGTQILLRFPDGALPSGRWRWFSRLSAGGFPAMTGGASGGQELVDGGGPSPRHAGRLPWLADAWTPQQRQRLRQLGPGTWPQPLPGVLGVSPGWPDNNPVHPAVEIAIYPDVIRLAAQTLHAPDTSHRAGR